MKEFKAKHPHLSSQTDFIRKCHAAVDRLFAHRKELRRIMARFAFTPEGLWIQANIRARTNAELAAGRERIIPWQDLETVDGAAFLMIVDEVCEPSRAALTASPRADQGIERFAEFSAVRFQDTMDDVRERGDELRIDPETQCLALAAAAIRAAAVAIVGAGGKMDDFVGLLEKDVAEVNASRAAAADRRRAGQGPKDDIQ